MIEIPREKWSAVVNVQAEVRQDHFPRSLASRTSRATQLEPRRDPWDSRPCSRKRISDYPQSIGPDGRQSDVVRTFLNR